MIKTRYLLTIISILMISLIFSGCTRVRITKSENEMMTENEKLIEEAEKTPVEEDSKKEEINNPTQIGNISFSYPKEYKLTESSIDTFRTYMYTEDINKDSEYFNVKFYDRNEVQLIKDSFNGTNIEYNDFDGVAYTTDTNLYGFAFEEDNNTYIFEATNKEVLDNILNSLTELDD